MHIANRSVMFQAAVSLLPMASKKPLHELLPDEEIEVTHRAARLARGVARALGDNFLSITTDSIPESLFDADATAATRHAPEWIRIPNKGRCPYTQLGRSMIYQLITPSAANDHRAPVRSISLRQRGAAKGMRLVSYDSLMDYIRSHEVHGP